MPVPTGGIPRPAPVVVLRPEQKDIAMSFSSLLSLIALALNFCLLSGCAAEGDDPYLLYGNSDALRPAKAGPLGADDVAILRFLNDAETSFEILDGEVGLEARAARGLISHRDGADGVPDTDDDDIFNSIDEVDAVLYVGPAALDRLFDYSLATAQDGDITLVSHEGVRFTTLQMQQVLRTANTASEFQLDEIAGLDARTTQGILSDRPFADLRTLAGARHVGPMALRKLKIYAPKFSRIGR